MLDQELFIGGLLDGARDALAMLRAEYEGAEDEQIKSALQEFEALLFALGRHLTRAYARLGKMSTGENRWWIQEFRACGR